MIRWPIIFVVAVLLIWWFAQPVLLAPLLAIGIMILIGLNFGRSRCTDCGMKEGEGGSGCGSCERFRDAKL